MKMTTSDGIDIYYLPDNAYCKVCGCNPETADECPLRKFDDFVDVCKPDVCEHYTEDDEYALKNKTEEKNDD